jgi:hypothetical protein
MSMKKLTITMILLATVALCTASYFLLIKFSTPENAYRYPAPPFVPLTPTHVPTAIPTKMQTTQCTPNQVQATISTQGAAGSIYGNLILTNTGKEACDLEIGNEVIATFDGKYIVPENIVIHDVQSVPSEDLMLAPGEKLYSQVHYPNGPQCQSGIKPIQISFLVNQSSISFEPDSHTGNLILQACSSAKEKTIIDFWPLSKTPITP